MNEQRFLLRYEPAKHEGAENIHLKDYFYWVRVSGDVFANKGQNVGFVATDEKDSQIKRFRWDRVSSMIGLK